MAKRFLHSVLLWFVVFFASASYAQSYEEIFLEAVAIEAPSLSYLTEIPSENLEVATQEEPSSFSEGQGDIGIKSSLTQFQNHKFLGQACHGLSDRTSPVILFSQFPELFSSTYFSLYPNTSPNEIRDSSNDLGSEQGILCPTAFGISLSDRIRSGGLFCHSKDLPPLSLSDSFVFLGNYLSLDKTSYSSGQHRIKAYFGRISSSFDFIVSFSGIPNHSTRSLIPAANSGLSNATNWESIMRDNLFSPIRSIVENSSNFNLYQAFFIESSQAKGREEHGRRSHT